MELDEADAYTAAALFTLALHQSQVEVGVDGNGQKLSESERVWGSPRTSDTDELLEHPEILVNKFERFWGWDSCGPNGLCRQTYQRLGVPESKWVGLLKLPGLIGDFSSCDWVSRLVNVVQMYGEMLDPELTVTDEKAQQVVQDGLLNTAPEMMDMTEIPSDVESTDNITPRRNSTDGSGDGVDTGHKAPLEQDVGVSNWIEPDKSVQGSRGTGEEQGSQAAELPDGQETTKAEAVQSSTESDEACAVASPCSTHEPLSESNLPCEISGSELDNCTATSPNSTELTALSQRHFPTAKSCAVVYALLEACVGELPNVPSKKKADKNGVNVLEGFGVRGQWYDARSRVALYRVLYWLEIPQSTMEAFETSLASSLLATRKDGALKPSRNTLARWAKVGAVAIGGGAAIALTGGLAAPAIAAGLGSAVSLVGGSAATASAISGFAASTAGTATITSAFGAYGASQTGGYMARRTANVKEFGFWDVSEIWEDPEKVNQKTPPTSSKSSKFKLWTSKKLSLKQAQGKRAIRDQEEAGKHETSGSKEEGPVSPVTDPKEPILSSTAQSSDAPCPSGACDGAKDTSETENQPPGQVDSENMISSWLKTWVVTKEHRPLYPLPVSPNHPEWKLSLVICVTGWVQKYEDFLHPWTCLSNASTDRFALVWEAKELKQVGDGLMAMIRSQVATEGAKWFIKKYFYTGLLSAVAIPMLLMTLTSMTIDNKWAIAQQRACKAGQLLAQCFAEGLHGHRPVTLIGFSLGSRLIYHCLLELSRLGKVGIIENVIMLGAPVGLNHHRWCMVRSVVAGRLVNGYSSKDWVLGITYRASQGFIRKAAGCCPVEVPGIENVDLSDVIGGHTDYLTKMPEICEVLNIQTNTPNH